jgi:hypothetical protein
MNSIINLFIYEVKGPTPELYFREYIKKKSYFGKLLIKKDNNKTNTSIIPIELRETDKLRKNIISKIIELDKIIKISIMNYL